MILVNEIRVKYEVLIQLDEKKIDAKYFDSSTVAKEFTEAYNRRMPGIPITPGSEATYNGAFPLDG